MIVVFSVLMDRLHVRLRQAERVAVEENIMNRKYIKIIFVAVIILGIGGLVGYQFTGGKEYSHDLNELRAQFNRDKGKVRLVILLSPT